MNPDDFFESWDPFLYKYHLYYRDLSKEGKERFIRRVQSILRNVEIIGKEDLEVNEEIRILVVSNLVQLTFGLKEFWLFGYEYIYLYPEAFFQQASDMPVSGSTYQTRIIALSWQDFAFDHLHAHSGKNVSLAQFALGLVQTVRNGKRYDLEFGSYLDRWYEIMRKECELKSEGPAAVHLSENPEDIAYVFSRAIELFFEKPDTFKKELPTSYVHLCLLMRQDPLNVTNDYRYERSRLNRGNLLQVLPIRIPVNYRYKTWHWVYNIPFFGMSICPIILYFILDKYLVHPSNMVGFIAVTGLVIGLALYPYMKTLGLFRSVWWAMLTGLLGPGPILVTFLLTLNQIHGFSSTSEISQHKIASFYQSDDYSNQVSKRTTTFNFSDQFLVDYPHVRTFHEFDTPPLNSLTLYNGVEYEFRNGLIGIPFIYKKNTY